MVLVAVVLGAVVVLGGLLFWQRSGADDGASVAAAEDVSPSDTTDSGSGSAENADPGGAAPDESPSESDPPADDEAGGVAADVDHAVCPDDVPVEVCDAAAFVERFRGQPFKVFPTVEFADDAEFEERLLSDFDEDVEDLEIAGDVFRSLGLIPEDADLVDALRKSLEIGVVGFYRTDTKELLIRGTDLDLYAQDVIVHELVHAHDDQWLDLDRPELDDVDDESDFGFTAMVEGNAVRVEDAWKAELTAAEQAELSQLELSFLDPADLDILLAIPTIILQLQFSPYTDGPVLVESVAAEGGGGASGEAAVNAAITEPPRWSEEVLHPELFPDGDPPSEVPAPQARGELTDDGVIGELVFDIWFGDSVGDGWGGDRYVSWSESDAVCTAIHLVADSDKDFSEFMASADSWAASDPTRRRTESVDLAGQPGLLIEGCV